ncbi:MAG: DUF4190 domain-containing protein [Thermoanaerobaculia bacterium]|nr:DUF4190 domain-containing protein [Thermoanaerobaculia bacterium]
MTDRDSGSALPSTQSPPSTKSCPTCGESIRFETAFCGHCGGIATSHRVQEMAAKWSNLSATARQHTVGLLSALERSQLRAVLADQAAANPTPRPRLADDPLTRAILPVGRSLWAIAAGYLGIFSLLLIFAPLAIVTGILAIRDIRKHPEKRGLGRAWFGIIMGALGTLILLAVVLSAAAAGS